MDPEHKIGSVLEVAIERIVPRGFGIGFAEGLTVFVALAVKGDRVRIRIDQLKGKTAFAEIVEVVEPGPERITPPCRYFGECGGCDFQQMTYAEQLASKVEIIRDCLHRIAKVEFVEEIEVIASPAEFGYRSRAQWHLNTVSKEIGYYRRNSRDLVAIEECPILAPELNAELKRLRWEYPWEMVWAEKGYIDAARGDKGAVSLNSPGVLEPSEIEFSVLGETFTYSAGVFFQGNQMLVPALLEAALRRTTGKMALDLYSGVGLFSLPMGRVFEKVIAVEENPVSVEFAISNAAANGHGNIEFRTESVRSFLRNIEVSDVDLILLDPPRAGTEKDTIENIIRIGAPQISYVACEPSVLARDLKRFDESGYKIDSITAIDLFPQTHHIETVARLSRR